MKTLWTMILTTVLLSAVAFAQTTPNPVMLGPIDPGNSDTSHTWMSRAVSNGYMYFKMYDGTQPPELDPYDASKFHGCLWRTDGTPAGTSRYADVMIKGGITCIGNLVYFTGSDLNANNHDDPWRSDGTSAGTFRLIDLGRNLFYSEVEFDFESFNGLVYFKHIYTRKNAVPNVFNLMVTDGTVKGTGIAASVTDGLRDLAPVGTQLFIKNADLWISDGSSSGTSLLKDICPGTGSCVTSTNQAIPAYWDAFTYRPFIMNGKYFARFGDGSNGDELWMSDGTVAGTFMVADINPGAGSSWPCMFAEMDGVLYFSAYDELHGFELWRSDGTSSGTVRVKDINPTGNSAPRWITTVNTAAGERLFFSADDGVHGHELWISDGTEAGTTMVTDINTSGSSNPRFTRFTPYEYRCSDEEYMLVMTSYNGIVYFGADDGNGYELFRSDGTVSGTYKLVDINPQGASRPIYITEVNGKILFFAYEPVNGFEWYSYDPSLPVNFSSNTPPVASFTATPDNGLAPLLVAFDGSTSNDPDGTISTYEWDFGDGNTATGVTASHSYPYVGTYTATLTVTDDKNATGTTSLPIIVTTTPPLASFTATPTSGDAPLTVYFDGSASSDPDAGGGIMSYDWDFGDGNTGSGATISHTYQLAGTYTATLTVTDAAHATDDASTPITVSSTGGADIFVDQQSIARVTLPGNRTAAQSTMIIRNNVGVVQGAVVYASYTGPTSGTVSGTTDVSGSVMLETAGSKRDLNLDWCFTVTDIQLTGYTFNDQMGEPYFCEGSSPKRSIRPPASCLLHAPYPNPFGAGS
ncbi:MAG: PKD domain-containing protein, partial [Bacteroidetes bacterium]|nr:PKD domain-containing protein [Bacteroidota bacterium]